MSVFCCSLLGFSAYSSSERWHYINVIGVMYFFIFWIFYSHSPPSLHFSIRLHYTHFSLRDKQINKTITKRREKKSNFRKNLMFFVGRLQISRHQHAFISSFNLPKKMPISLFSIFFLLNSSLITSNVCKSLWTFYWMCLRTGEFTGTWTYAIWLNMSKWVGEERKNNAPNGWSMLVCFVDANSYSNRRVICFA